MEIVQGYEWTTHGYKCINKCTLEVIKLHSFYQTYRCTFSRNYQGFKASCTPCISRGEFCTKTFYLPQIMIQNFDLSLQVAIQHSEFPFQTSGFNFLHFHLIFHLSPLISFYNLFEISHLSPNQIHKYLFGLIYWFNVKASIYGPYLTTVKSRVLTRLVQKHMQAFSDCL